MNAVLPPHQLNAPHSAVRSSSLFFSVMLVFVSTPQLLRMAQVMQRIR
jgi:hypothetical protein